MGIIKFILKISLVLGLLAFVFFCTRQEKLPIPQEGDIALWKIRPELIIKARLGQRRVHIPHPHPKLEDAIYEPERERYLGQFAIDYIPEKFPTLTYTEVKAIEERDKKHPPAIKSIHLLEFNLMLNGAKSHATDNSPHGPNGLDSPDQVKVIVSGYDLSLNQPKNTKQFFESALHKSLNPKSHHKKYGLDCYDIKEPRLGYESCFGKSTHSNISGFSFFAPKNTNGLLFGNETRKNFVHSTELVYGGITVEWHTDIQNIGKFQEIDAAIWRLLDAWNVSPQQKTKIYTDKKKIGDLITWKLTPELIIKTTLGQRNTKGYRDFEQFRFLGQFPIDYQPKKEYLSDSREQIEDISKVEAGLTFNLLLNNPKGTPVSGFHEPNVIDQVKVKIHKVEGGQVDSPRKTIQSLLNLNGFIKGEKFDRFGLECYPTNHGDAICIGQSNNLEHTEMLIYINSDATYDINQKIVRALVYTTNYGGLIRVEWRTHFENLKDWKQIDAAIWRLLNTWNVAPLRAYQTLSRHRAQFNHIT